MLLYEKGVFIKKILKRYGTIITLYGEAYTQDLIKCMVRNSPNEIKTLKSGCFFTLNKDLSNMQIINTKRINNYKLPICKNTFNIKVSKRVKASCKI
jgi:hypothetical protein